MPSFIIVGAQKAGTTSLYYYLSKHPQISMSIPDEVHYFDRDDIYPDHEWYHAQFELNHLSIRAVGEKTPIYCFWPGAIERIHKYDPNVYLIMLLRNPTERAISHYFMEFQRNHEHRSIEEALSPLNHEQWSEPEWIRLRSYLPRGRYVEQLDTIYQYFPPKQVFCCRYEDIITTPEKVLRPMMEFIGVDPMLITTDFEYRRKGNYALSDLQLREKLNEYFAPYNTALYKKYDIRTDDWK